MKRTPPILIALAAIAIALSCGCREKSPAPATPPSVQEHEPQPPHGGTLVQLGNEENYLEFVLDSSTGKLQAYILDGEAENFIRAAVSSFEVAAAFQGRSETLVFKAIPNRATGEQVGSTSLFEAQADWLKQAPGFTGTIKEVSIGGNRYQNVTFHFPKASG